VNELQRLTGAAILGVCMACAAGPPEVSANDNRTPAGARRGDTLVVQMVVQAARWHPETADGPYIDTEALGEEGKAPSIPAPLLRVPTGTVVAATVRNALADSTIWLRGLATRPAAAGDSLAIPPGESRTVTFAAGAPGTYAYGVTVGQVDYSKREREQLIGAFIVDSSGVTPDDRVFVMNIWGEPRDSTAYPNVLAINGKSFPHSETIAATTGDTLRWRWVNGTIRPHPMHLHGFYFTVEARGTARADTVFGAAQRRSVVTEVMEPFGTMVMSWVPDRDGRWLFHCHIAFHSVAEGARLEMPSDPHAMMSGDPGVHMAGLVLGISVKAAPGWTPEPRIDPRTLRLFVRESVKLGRAPRALGYAIEHGPDVPTAPLRRIGGPPLVLTRGQPTDITVINQLSEPTAVHWHGLELESYSDGVSGWSGQQDRRAPGIAAADSFTARLTMPRAGTFMYHTHLNDLDQLTSGLYGAIVVLEPRDPFDPATDHVYVAGWDGLADPRLLINGDSVLAPLTWRPGSRHRIRLVNIGPAEKLQATLTVDSATVTWRPIAKDGADLPAHQAVSAPATYVIDVGETADFEFRPTRRGVHLLTLKHAPSRFSIAQQIVVR
jgi:FtsP/CotA-like multicopper oxidase with cupredoxin domain